MLWATMLLPAAALFGFLLGSARPLDVPSSHEAAAEPAKARSTADTSEVSEQKLGLDQVRTRLQLLIEESPFPRRDLEMQARIEGLLQDLPAETFAELHDVILQHLRGRGDYKSEYFAKEKPDGRFFNEPVRSLIYKAWAKKEGRAATEAAYSIGVYSPFASKIFAEWARRDALAAFEWSRSGDMRERFGNLGEELPGAGIQILIEMDPAEAMRRMESGDDSLKASMLPSLIRRSHADPESRERLFGIAATLPQREEVERDMILAWSDQQLNEAIRGIASLEMEAASKEELEIACLVRIDDSAKIPDAVTDWFTRHPDRTAIPSKVASLTEAWLEVDPAKSTEWLNHLPAGERREAIHAALLESSEVRAMAEDAKPRPPTFARLITDDHLRRGFYESHFRFLKEVKDTETALKWREELPEADRPAIDAE